MCSLSRLNRTRATCSGAALGANPCCGLTPRTEWHQDGTRGRPNTRAAYPSPVRMRRSHGSTWLSFQISQAQTLRTGPRHHDQLWRRGAKSHNEICINEHPGWLSERGLRGFARFGQTIPIHLRSER